MDAGATLDDLREAVTTLEDAERIARRVFGSANPLTLDLQDHGLRIARAALRAREETSPSAENFLQSLGDFTGVKDSKLGARISLGFTSTKPTGGA
jgi:hypothetical protein